MNQSMNLYVVDNVFSCKFIDSSQVNCRQLRRESIRRGRLPNNEYEGIGFANCLINRHLFYRIFYSHNKVMFCHAFTPNGNKTMTIHLRSNGSHKIAFAIQGEDMKLFYNCGPNNYEWKIDLPIKFSKSFHVPQLFNLEKEIKFPSSIGWNYFRRIMISKIVDEIIHY